MTGVRWFGVKTMGVGIFILATNWGPLGRGQGFLGAGLEARFLVEAGLVMEGRGIIGLTVGAPILELAISGIAEVDLVSDNAG